MLDIEARIRMLDALLEIMPPVSWAMLAMRETDDPQMEVLNQALASEWSAIQQYQHHLASWCDDLGLGIKPIWEEHLADEQQHMGLITERIAQLHSLAIPAPAPALLAESDIGDAIRADLTGEQEAVRFYSQIIRASGLKDNVTRVVFEHILMDEADHQKSMEDLLQKYEASIGASR